MKQATKIAAPCRCHLYLVPFILIALAAAGCRTATIQLPGDVATWTADPGKCITINEADGTTTIAALGRSGPQAAPMARLVAKDFRWAGGEIEFKMYDPGNIDFAIAFYDDNFAKVRESNAGNWVVIEDGKPVPISRSANKWQVHRMHALEFGGEDALIEKGYRALGGPVAKTLGPLGLASEEPWAIVSENFKIGTWNHIRLTVDEGLITMWVNGLQGESVQTDRRLDGDLAFEVFSGEIKLKDVRTRRLH
jgi:hypothetical protein